MYVEKFVRQVPIEKIRALLIPHLFKISSWGESRMTHAKITCPFSQAKSAAKHSSLYLYRALRSYIDSNVNAPFT